MSDLPCESIRVLHEESMLALWSLAIGLSRLVCHSECNRSSESGP